MRLAMTKRSIIAGKGNLRLILNLYMIGRKGKEHPQRGTGRDGKSKDLPRKGLILG